jgi:hypothetical protein
MTKGLFDGISSTLWHRAKSRLGRFAVQLAAVMLLFGCATGCGDKAQVVGRRRLSKAYQATYSCPGNFAYQTSHIYRDGAGHIRIDISGQGPTVVNVLDQNTNETILWAEGVNKYVRRRSLPTDPLVMRVRVENMAKGGEDLGSKIINGHKCHGWRAAGTEVWFDDDYGCEVLATVGNLTTTMTQFSPQAPDPSVFQPPPGYIQVPAR